MAILKLFSRNNVYKKNLTNASRDGRHRKGSKGSNGQCLFYSQSLLILHYGRPSPSGWVCRVSSAPFSFGGHVPFAETVTERHICML